MTIMSKYRNVEHNEWIRPVMRDYGMCCCDCGLVHRVDFRVIRWGRGHKIEMRARRANRATGQIRRHMPKEGKV